MPRPAPRVAPATSATRPASGPSVDVMERSSAANLTGLVVDPIRHSWRMTRIDIEIDDELLAEAMWKTGVGTPDEVVDLALRRLVDTPLSAEFLESLQGIGWDGDLDGMRRSKSQDWN
jgi:Arc/MetJ family transcription regulator